MMITFLLFTSCSKTLYPVPHTKMAEKLPNGEPSGTFYEQHCLKPGRVYTLELPTAVVFGRVIRMPKHERLVSLKKKALDDNDTIVFQV
ncbi:MAG: hypothetical protein ACKOYP_08615, partial [Bacteroidota bacterium]